MTQQQESQCELSLHHNINILTYLIIVISMVTVRRLYGHGVVLSSVRGKATLYVQSWRRRDSSSWLRWERWKDCGLCYSWNRERLHWWHSRRTRRTTRQCLLQLVRLTWYISVCLSVCLSRRLYLCLVLGELTLCGISCRDLRYSFVWSDAF